MAEKKDIRDRAKSLWLKGMKAIGNTAASIANNTRYKVDEVTIQNRRREVLGDLAVKSYALWLKGVEFPEEMTRMLEELKTLDEQLNDMRAEKYASMGRVPESETQEEEPAEEEDEEPLPVEDSPVSAEINELFDNADSVDKSAEKINSSLEQLSDRIRRFPQGRDNGTENGQE